jgi:hypothetical protein
MRRACERHLAGELGVNGTGEADATEQIDQDDAVRSLSHQQEVLCQQTEYEMAEATYLSDPGRCEMELEHRDTVVDGEDRIDRDNAFGGLEEAAKALERAF